MIDEELFIMLMKIVEKEIDSGMNSGLILKSIGSVFYGTCKSYGLSLEDVNKLTKWAYVSSEESNLH